MKNYFDFTLNGKTIFPYYLWIYLAYIALCISSVNYNASASDSVNPAEVFTPAYFANMGVIVGYLVVVLLFYFFVFREILKAISFNNELLRFEGEYGKYLKINVIGVLLTIVTLGVYSCWLQRNVNRFFAGNTSYANRKFKYNGLASTLFIIITLFIIVYTSSILAIVFLGKTSIVAMVAAIVVAFISLCSLIYFSYRWYIDISYDNKKIKLAKGGHVAGLLYISQEMFFVLITLGLYSPAAIVRISRYFIEHIEVRDEENALVATVGSDINIGDDYLYILGQILLLVLTFGLYGPWSMSNILRRIITKTYVQTTD